MIQLIWDDDQEDQWSARDLRVRCACAYCKSEVTGERILDPATVPADITVTHMDLVGNYGVHIHFSDGHQTGIYKFRDLRRASTH
jgi:ATP-binding protein involved in chromosome partitioning